MLFNIWENHENFLIVQSSWSGRLQGNKLKCSWHKLKNLEHHLRQLNNCEFKRVTEKIQNIRNELRITQSQFSSHYSYVAT